MVRDILLHLRSLGAYAEKNHGNYYTRTGAPDIYACIIGRFIAIEVKAPGKLRNVSKAQEQCMTEIQYAGGIAFVADSVQMVEEQLRAKLPSAYSRSGSI